MSDAIAGIIVGTFIGLELIVCFLVLVCLCGKVIAGKGLWEDGAICKWLREKTHSSPCFNTVAIW